MTAAALWVGGAFLQATTATIDSFDMTSGANDIIVVRHELGDLQSSAFNVRFGKAKVIRRSDKYVYVEVNGKRVQGVLLKLGPSGEAFWVTPATRGVPQEARCSPITSPRSPPEVSPSNSQGSSPQSGPQQRTGESSFELGRGTATDIVEPAAAPQLPVVKGETYADPTADITEEQLMQDDEERMMNDDEADRMLAESSHIMKELNERLHHEAAQQAEDQEVTGSIPVATGTSAENGPESELRLARSAEGKTAMAINIPPPGVEDPLDELEADDLPDVKLTVWKRVHDRESGRDVYWNMRTNECTDEAPPDYESDGDSGINEVPNLSSDEEEAFDEDNICAKSLYPTKEQLAKLDLKDGENEITFVVYTTLRGRQSVTCSAFLWDAHSQVVVSDVDGTVTRSDVLGHILPKVGKDWTHKGICSLYQRIVDNGYKMIYLSSRSISQIQSTREYLEGVMQDEKRLPRGPLLVAPDRIFAAFTREVVKRTPHEFKMRMLHAVKTAYPETHEPFYAGFGNRVNDAWAYTSVGIKEHKVFLIDPNSLIHVFDRRVKFRAYGSLDQLADQAFPPLHATKKNVPTEFNSFNYWSLSPSVVADADIDPNDIDSFAATAPPPQPEGADADKISPPPSTRRVVGAWGSPPSIPPVLQEQGKVAASPSPPRSPLLDSSAKSSAKPADSEKAADDKSKPEAPNQAGTSYAPWNLSFWSTKAKAGAEGAAEGDVEEARQQAEGGVPPQENATPAEGTATPPAVAGEGAPASAEETAEAPAAAGSKPSAAVAAESGGSDSTPAAEPAAAAPASTDKA